MGSRWFVGVVAAVLAVGMVAPASADHASIAQEEYGKVIRVGDGDTADVDVYGDGTSTPVRVRFIGLQAPEVGTCGARAARRALAARIEGKRVRLTSSHGTVKSGRWLRHVAWQRSDHSWQDSSDWMLARGHGLWMTQNDEHTYAKQYHRQATAAAVQHQRLWDTARCRKGPYQGQRLHLVVQWDGDGNDEHNLNGEFVRITNRGSRAVDLSGWYLRDSGQYHPPTIPRGGKIGPGRTLTVHVGSGRNRRYRRYLGLKRSIFDNLSSQPGDGAYLVDRDGDYRAWQTYPCVRNCGHPAQGNLKIANVIYDAPGVDSDNINGEVIVLANTGTASIPLGEVVVERLPYNHEFPPNFRLAAGATLRLHMGKGTNSATHRYWGFDSAMLVNTGGVIRLRTFDAIPLDCYAWGSGSCSDY